jgi:feruloyl esterase
MRILVRLGAVVAGLFSAFPSFAAGVACETLAGDPAFSFLVAEAVTVPETGGVPAYCRIRGEAPVQLRFEARLPVSAWNGSFYQSGCGGFCGDFNPDRSGFSNTIMEAVRRGYAAIMSDYGHRGAGADASWAIANEMAIELYADRGIPRLHDVGMALLDRFYGAAPRRSYFSGCSNGGRQAAVAAQRYPDLFDGILSGAPVLHLTLNGGLYGTWLVQKNTDADGGHVIGPAFNAKIPALRREVLAQCPGGGPGDEVIRDPRQCRIDPNRFARCRDGDTSATCFSDAERETLAAWYRGPSDRSGRELFFATPAGSEPFWPVWLTGTEKAPAGGMALARDYLKLAFSPDDFGPRVESLTFDFDRDPPRLAARARLLDATNPDLSAFARSGGKLIMYHGWADPVVLPQRTATYYEEAVARNGGLDAIQNFFRLFMIAGVGHCWELPGPAPDRFDPIAAIEAWVERGLAPDAVSIEQRGKEGTVIRRGILRPYPELQVLEPMVSGE